MGSVAGYLANLISVFICFVSEDGTCIRYYESEWNDTLFGRASTLYGSGGIGPWDNAIERWLMSLLYSLDLSSSGPGVHIYISLMSGCNVTGCRGSWAG